MTLYLKQIEKSKDRCDYVEYSSDVNNLLAGSLPPNDLVRLFTAPNHVVASYISCAFLYSILHYNS